MTTGHASAARRDAAPDLIVRTTKDDPRVAAFMNVRERDLVGRHGRFVAEGANVLRVLLSHESRFRAEAVLLSEKRESLVTELDMPADLPVYSLPQAEVDSLVGFPIHRGVLAIGVRAKDAALEEMTARTTPAHESATCGPRVLVAMMGIANHDNVGGILRNAAAFGAAGVVMDEGTCDPLYRKAIRVSVGGALVVPWRRYPTAKEMIESLQNAHIDVLALSPRGRANVLDLRPARDIAILLGPEGPGLPEELLAALPTARIPIVTGFDSLNVSVACGVALASLLSERP